MQTFPLQRLATPASAAFAPDELSPAPSKEPPDECDRAAQLEAQGGDLFPSPPLPASPASLAHTRSCSHAREHQYAHGEQLDPLSVLGGGLVDHLNLWKGRRATFGDLSGVPAKQQQELFHLPAGLRRGLTQRQCVLPCPLLNPVRPWPRLASPGFS